MSKPIQIAISHTRSENEQYGQEKLVVLCDDGRIYLREVSMETRWQEITGPWEVPHP